MAQSFWNMESYTLNICGRNEGPLFQDRAPNLATGPILTVTNQPVLHVIKGRSLGFVQFAYDRSGHQIAAGDNMGNVYIFNFKKRRFWRICNLGTYCCTSLAFIPNTQDIIIAMSNCAIALWDSEQCVLKKSVTAHKNCVHNIFINEGGTRALTSSTEEAIMWDLPSDFCMLNKLSHGKDINILKAFFVPVLNYIACAFRTSFVYLWDINTLKFKASFSCCEDGSLWLKAIEVSRNGKFIACGGKSDSVFIWNIETSSFSHKISIAKDINSIFQILLLSDHRLKRSVIAVLDQSGCLHLYDMESKSYVFQLEVRDEKIVSVSECGTKLALLTSSGALKLYKINSFMVEPLKHELKVPQTIVETSPKVERKKEVKDSTPAFDVKSVKILLSTLKEYPALQRNFIWSQLLYLPQSDDYMNFYNESYRYSLSGTKFDSLNRSLKGTFIRLLSMLVQWCPFLKEVDYIPNLTFPFVNFLRNAPRMCFELLITLIRNWCQNWFSFIPFPPYNILCVVENLLVYHDRLLLHHFMQHNISPEVYAFSILRTSFSDIFVKDQWLKLWDHIFTNQPSFILFLVVAFNMLSRDVLLQCVTDDDFKMFYLQKKNKLVSPIIEEAYRLKQSTPLCFDPSPVVGKFTPLPRSGYPPLTRFTHCTTNFRTLTRARILEGEMKHWKNVFEESNAWRLEEVKKLMDIRRNLLMQSLDQKNTDELKRLEEKVMKIQKLIQENLIPQDETIAKPTPVVEEVAIPEENLENSDGSDCLDIINEVLKLREKFIEDDVLSLAS